MTDSHRRTGMGLTALALTLVALLVVQLLPAVAAPPGSELDRFVDDDRHLHEGSINALAAADIVNGCNPPDNDRFCPDRAVTRGEMATILRRSLGLEASTLEPFDDSSRSVHHHDIVAIAAAGVTRGCNPPANTRFCPFGSVTRGQIAALLSRALDLPISERTFSDTAGHVFEDDIARLAEAGITLGCNPPTSDRFCPDRVLSRGEMATLVARALGLEPINIDHPTTTTVPRSTTTTSPSSAGRSASFPGEPQPGTLYWGAHVHGNGDPGPRHEVPAGHPMVLRRSFFQWHHRDGWMVRTIEDDIANGRLSWVSVKTPSWAAMAAGHHDDEIDGMLRALQKLEVDIWLTVHHEPEGGGGVNQPDDPAGPAGHLGMNRRVRERMNALNVKNVALAPILMAWSWTDASGRNPDEWWDSSVYDFLGIDTYMAEEASMINQRWYDVRAWAREKGVAIAVGEWGIQGTDTAAGERVREFFEHAADSHRDGRGGRVIGLAYFDSPNVYSGVVWELKGEPLRVFQELFRDPRNADPR